MKQTKRKRESAVPLESPLESPLDSDVAAPSAAGHADASTIDAPPVARLYALQSSCTVRDSVMLREQLLKFIDDPLPVTLDLRAVERVDTAAMQVLCAFVRDRSAAGRPVSWLGAPESFVEAVRLLGMSQLLGMPVAPSTGAAAARA